MWNIQKYEKSRNLKKKNRTKSEIGKYRYIFCLEKIWNFENLKNITKFGEKTENLRNFETKSNKISKFLGKESKNQKSKNIPKSNILLFYFFHRLKYVLSRFWETYILSTPSCQFCVLLLQQTPLPHPIVHPKTQHSKTYPSLRFSNFDFWKKRKKKTVTLH